MFFRAVVAGAAAFLLSGCLSGSTSGSLVDVEYEGTTMVDGVQTHVGTGVVRGIVLDEAGSPLPDINIAIIGTDRDARTDLAGAFVLADALPGNRTLRASHPDFLAVERSVEVVANRTTTVEIVLVAADSVPADMRAHVHDYWGDDKVKTVIDAKAFPWDQDSDTNNLYPFHQATAETCVYPSGQVWDGQPRMSFDDPETLVWAGTERIEIKIDWTDTDNLNKRTEVMYGSAEDDKYRSAGRIGRGETLTIPVRPAMWDRSHQAYSLWDFRVCVAARETLQVASTPAPGSFRVTMKLYRMEGPIPPEPAHPRFWEAGPIRPLINETTRTVTFVTMGTSQFYYRQTWEFMYVPEDGRLVAPGTTEIVALLSWSCTGPMLAPLSLTFKPASVRMPPSEFNPALFEVIKPSKQDTASREYHYVMDPAKADKYYQKFSTWAFAFNRESQEKSKSWEHPCAGDLKVTVKLDLVNADVASS